MNLSEAKEQAIKLFKNGENWVEWTHVTKGVSHCPNMFGFGYVLVL